MKKSLSIRGLHKVPFFSHIGNEHLTDDFFLSIEAHKDNIIEKCGLYEHQKVFISRNILDNLSFLELTTFLEFNFGITWLKYPSREPLPGRIGLLDEYLLAPMLLREINHLNDADKGIGYLNSESLALIVSKLGPDKIVHDSRNEFFACYINSFLRNHPLKLSSALHSVLNMSIDDVESRAFQCFHKETLKLFRHATYLNAANKVGATNQDELNNFVLCFEGEDVKSFLEFDFLDGSLADYKRLLKNVFTWIELDELDDPINGEIISDWLIHQCAIFFAYHLNESKQKKFISAVIDTLSLFLDFSAETVDSVKKAMFIQSVMIEPENSLKYGISKEQFLKPLADIPKNLEKSFSSINGVYTESSNKNYFWLTTTTIHQIQRRSGFNFSPDDVFSYFYGKDHQCELLRHLKPIGYLDYFINTLDSASNAHLYQMACDLIDLYPNVFSRDIQISYAIKLVRRNKDKAINQKKLGLNWIDKTRVMNTLREEGLLGCYSAVSLLNLSTKDFIDDMSILSNVSKRMLLANDLDF